MKLSKNLSLAEVVRSETAKRLGIDNNPTKEHLENLKTIAEKVFQPIRDHFGCPIHISSGYRSEALNIALKYSSKTSLHMQGCALDIDMDFTNVSNKEIFDYIKDNLEFDTLIWEFCNEDDTPRWVHVSYREGKNRNQVLEAYKEEVTGLTKYKMYEPRENKKETKGHKSRKVSSRENRSTEQST
jgi:zinc D-Ala-D-Ala carboxypeptidase